MNTYYSVQNIESTNHWIYPLFICLGGIALLIIYQLVKKKKLFKNTTSQVSQNVGRIVFPCVIIGGFIGTVVMFVSGIVEDSRSRDSLNKQRFHIAAGRMKNCFYQDQRNSTTISFEVQDVEFVYESIVQESDNSGDYSKFTCNFEAEVFHTYSVIDITVIPQTSPPTMVDSVASFLITDAVYKGYFKR